MGSSCSVREAILQYAQEQFGAEPEYLWAKFPSTAVLRHANNSKWYALFTNVPKRKLGLSENEPVDVLVIKCDPNLIGSLLTNPGFLPGYHMSKSTWITILLDGTVPVDEIRTLLDLSYDLTKTKI